MHELLKSGPGAAFENLLEWTPPQPIQKSQRQVIVRRSNKPVVLCASALQPFADRVDEGAAPVLLAQSFSDVDGFNPCGLAFQATGCTTHDLLIRYKAIDNLMW